MQFDLEKCAKVVFKEGSLVKSEIITLDVNTKIKEIERNKTRKYLWINEANGIIIS